MFTGIIEAKGLIKAIKAQGTNKTFQIESVLAPELKVDQSLSHNGVCLTIEALDGMVHQVTAIEETLTKTNLGLWKTGDFVNLERCLSLNGRLDGHIVQGHVDGTATCVSRIEKEGSWEFRFRFEPQFAALVIEKGSISLNGISLTVFAVTQNEFSVAIIPYTYEHTSISAVSEGSIVNLEFDMIGKYMARHIALQNKK